MSRRIVAVWIVGLLVIGGLLGFLLYCPTEVNGTEVSGNQFDGLGGPWTLAGSPYIVIGNVNVPMDKTLTVEPGVEVKFNGYYNMAVWGRLIAKGTETNRIVITSNKTTPAPDDWNQLTVYNTGRVEMEYCDLNYSKWGLYIDSTGSNKIINCSFSFNYIVGIYLYKSPSNTIINSTFLDNGKDGIFLYQSSNNYIAHNTFSWNGMEEDIYLYQSSNNNRITNNTFNDNSDGVRIESSSNNRIYHNNFLGTTQAYDDRSNNFWNEPYPEGGNYWSDYTGTDINSGPDQDIPGSDGIGDTPYNNIRGSGGAKDNYPLMEPVPIDTTPPAIYDIIADPDPQEVGGNVKISAIVIDIYQVTEVSIEIYDPGDNPIGNFSMVYDSIDDRYYFNTTYSVTGTYSFTIWASDINDNWNSVLGSFEIRVEVEPPSITDITAIPDPQILLGDVNISALVTDNVELYGVWIDITDPTGNPLGYFPMLYDPLNGRYYWNQTYDIIGQYIFIIKSNDTSDNWAYVFGSFVIEEKISPTITDAIAVPPIQGNGGNVNISAIVTDNYRVFGVWVEIFDPTGNPEGNFSMMYDSSNDRYYFNDTYSILGIYTFNIWANDTCDNWDLYSGMFTIQNATILKQGWNLISIPLIQENQSLSKVLESIDGYYGAAQWKDITDPNDSWKHYKIGKPFGNDLSKLNESMSFWIHITQPGDTVFLYNGTQPTSNQTITLHPGWNMVGYPSMTSYNRTEGLNNLTFGDQVDAIWSYDTTTQKWEEMGESDYFIIGRGYYIHSKSECEWEVPL